MAKPPEQTDCPLLTLVDLQATFPASKNLIQSKYTEKRNPSCTFIWKSNVQVKELLGHRVDIPRESRLTITRAEIYSIENDWQRVLTSYGTQALIDVQNLGIKAVWSVKRHQLSVITDKYVFHVAVENPDQPTAEQKNAEHIAQQLLVSH